MVKRKKRGRPLEKQEKRDALIKAFVTDELHGKLRRLAAREHRTLSAMVHVILERAIRDDEKSA
jgi:hypothetical protein